MVALRRLTVGALALLLSACATYPNILQSRSPCVMEPGGWCSFTSDAAQDGFLFAMAATNAYQGDEDLYVLPEELKFLGRDKLPDEVAGKGFDYQVFELYRAKDKDGNWVKTDRAAARIIAFRGTDSSIADVWHGTVKDTQIELALEYFEVEKAKHGTDLPWIAVGHSLGGALATEVSLMYPDVTAWGFNLSPFYRGDAEANRANRTVVNERGEVLQGLRKNKPLSAHNVFTLNCSPRKKRFTKHKVRTIGDCLIWISAYRDEVALKVIKDNAQSTPPIIKPMVECGPADKVHPGPRGERIKPCIHVGRERERERD